MYNIKEVIEGIQETRQSTTQTKTEETPQESQDSQEAPCNEALPDGSLCQGVVTWKTTSSNGHTYSMCYPCNECRTPLGLHRCFGNLSSDKETAKSLYKAILARLETRPAKDDENAPARGQLRALVADPTGSEKSVFLTGPVGTGKTFLGMHALAACVKTNGSSCFYLPEHIAILAWRSSHDIKNPANVKWGNAVMERSRTAKVLMIDDFGQTRNTSDGALDAIDAIIMHRYDSGLNVIVTSNRSIDALEEARGHRVVSRLAGMTGGSVVHCTGKDWRA